MFTTSQIVYVTNNNICYNLSEKLLRLSSVAQCVDELDYYFKIEISCIS